MQSTKKVPKEVLGCGPVACLWYWVEYEHQQQLQTVGDQYLPLILEHDMVVWHAPCSGIVLQCLRTSASAWAVQDQVLELTVFNMEQSTDRTTCFSGQVAIYVMAFTPFTGSMAARR